MKKFSGKFVKASYFLGGIAATIVATAMFGAFIYKDEKSADTVEQEIETENNETIEE